MGRTQMSVSDDIIHQKSSLLRLFISQRVLAEVAEAYGNKKHTILKGEGDYFL